MSEDVGISFLEHPSFSREIAKFNKKYDNGFGYKSLKRLLEIQFHPINSQVVITPKVLRRIDNLGVNIRAFKVIMRVKNLSSGQSPRICFLVEGNLITFLCYGSHVDDYKDGELRNLIKKRAKEINKNIQFTSNLQ